MSTPPTYKPLEVEVTDFGPIAKAKIDLRPLTVFVGPSNTGKSYLATLIYALHRFFGGYRPPSLDFGVLGTTSPFYRAEVVTDTRDVTDEEFEDMLAWLTLISSCEVGGELPVGFRARVPESIAALVRPILRSASRLGTRIENEIIRCFGSNDLAHLTRYGSKYSARIVLSRQVFESNLSASPFTYEVAIDGSGVDLATSIPDSTPLQIARDDCNHWYWREILDALENLGRYRDLPKSRWPRTAKGLLNDFDDVVASSVNYPLNRVVHYLPADRAGVMHSHRVVVASLIQRSSRAGFWRDEPLPTLSGVHADFLEELVGLGDVQSFKIKSSENLSRTLENEVLGGQVRESQSMTGYPLFSYRPAGRKEDIPLMRASSMISELAPVVLYLRHLVQPGDVLIIEEPEAHLHPAMQAVFTRQLAAVVRAGVRVMITTHSDYVLEELANLVRMSELPEAQREGLAGTDAALSPEEVGVWLFEPKQRPKGSVVKEIPLDAEAGLYSAGYGDVSEALYNTSVAIDNRIGESKTEYESR